MSHLHQLTHAGLIAHVVQVLTSWTGCSRVTACMRSLPNSGAAALQRSSDSAASAVRRSARHAAAAANRAARAPATMPKAGGLGWKPSASCEFQT